MNTDNEYRQEAEQAFAKLDRRLREENLIPTRERPFYLKWPVYYKAAAILILISVLYLGVSYLPEQDQRTQIALLEKVNPSGQKSRFVLPDGSTVWLNAASKLSYPERFADSLRLVTLEGEAFFDVAHNPEKPFLIRAGNTQIKVLGTSFNVFTEEEITETVVLSGKVVFSSPHDSLLLTSHHAGRFDKQNDTLEKSYVVAEDYMAWTEGKLIFRDRSLGFVLSKLEKWYGVTFVVNNPSLLDCKITASFQDLSLETVLKQISFITPLRYKIESKQVSLNGEPCK